MQAQEVSQKLQAKYMKYFNHWKDFDLLTCILAIVGLILAIVDYETTFNYPPNVEALAEGSFSRVVITFTSLLSIISLLFRYYLQTYWVDFKNSIEL